MNEETIDIVCSCGQTLCLPCDPPGTQYECPTCGDKVFSPRKTKLKIQRGSLTDQTPPSQAGEMRVIIVGFRPSVSDIIRVVWFAFWTLFALAGMFYVVIFLLVGRIGSIY